MLPARAGRLVAAAQWATSSACLRGVLRLDDAEDGVLFLIVVDIDYYRRVCHSRGLPRSSDFTIGQAV
jgi:hypothetical protein